MKGDKMKKLLLVLLLVALAAFILVGCTPGTVTPVTTAGADCPTKVEVSGEVVIGNKTYIQGNSEEP
jgi:predicted small secreted protein